MSNRYYLMRHGESIANRKGLIVSHPTNALNQFGLTSKGAEQVTESALNTRLDDRTLIISSDFLRASETAEIVQDVLCIPHPIEHDQRLRERDFGNWEMQDDSAYESVWGDDLKSAERSNNGVEPITSVLSRTLALLADLDSQHQNQTILLVGHGDVLQIIATARLGLDPRHHRDQQPIKNAEIRRLSDLSQRLSA